MAEPEDNPFLDRFYQAQPGMGFATQLWFLMERYEQMRGLKDFDEPVVADYLFEKDKLFAYVNLSDAELDLYNRYYQMFREQVPSPDLVIYLQASPEVLKQRLKRKGVAGERAISDAYIEQVVEAYEHFFFHYTGSDTAGGEHVGHRFCAQQPRSADADEAAVGADQGDAVLPAS